MLTALAIAFSTLGIDSPGTSSDIVRTAGDEYWAFLEREDLNVRVEEGLSVDRLPDISLKQVEERAAFGRSLDAKLARASEKDLSHEDQLSLAILKEQARVLADAPARYWLTFPMTPYAFQALGVNLAVASHPFRGRSDAERYLALASQYADLVHAFETKLREQEKRGIRLPKEEIPLVAGAFASLGKEKNQNLLWVGGARLGSLGDSDREWFSSRLAETIGSRVRPAVSSLVSYISGDYASGAPSAVGLGQYPAGSDYYRVLAQRTTSPDAKPEEIHKLGLAAVERLNTELDGLRRKVGFSGTLTDFRRFLKTDSRFFAKTPEEVGERLLAAQNRIVAKVPDFFGKTPRAAYGVERLEPELEGAMTFGYYQIPTAQEPRGYYKYNGSQLSDRNLIGAGSLISHELVPGHHFQLNIQMENASLPKFRRLGGYDAFVEGWADYCSALADEMGMYADPYDRCGRVAFDLFLTTRLVVDTGMNLLGWPRARAIAYMKDNTLQSDKEIDTETLRYSCDIPAQALAYKMGMWKFVELREKARKELGPKFDIRRFHDAVIGSGAMPLAVLEKHVDWFIAQERAETR
ncbi:MAG TPA: DUF885 domain-containing protein [Thermoanaerobaculia bacterium]